MVAGISMLSQIAEYVDDSDTVTQMVRGIMMQLAASHARVRFVAWGAIAQFAEDHAALPLGTSFGQLFKILQMGGHGLWLFKRCWMFKLHDNIMTSALLSLT